jgi:hypothetical protein
MDAFALEHIELSAQVQRNWSDTNLFTRLLRTP